jgi:hypothetical protein
MALRKWHRPKPCLLQALLKSNRGETRHSHFEATFTKYDDMHNV